VKIFEMLYGVTEESLQKNGQRMTRRMMERCWRRQRQCSHVDDFWQMTWFYG